MKKFYVGSKQLNSHFRMFRVKCTPDNIDDVREEIMEKMSDYLKDYDGKLINVKEIRKTNELCFYFITGEQGAQEDWEQFLRNDLLRNYNVVPSVLEFGPA